MARGKEDPRRGSEKQAAQKSPRRPDTRITTGNDVSSEIVRPRRGELTVGEKKEIKSFLTDRFRPIDLTDDSFDTLIPTSLEAVSEMLDSGYLPSLAHGGFITHFPRTDLGYSASEEDPLHDGDPIPLHLSPLIAAGTIAQRHGLLSELNLHRRLDLPATDPELWDHLMNPRNKRYLREHGLNLEDVRTAIDNSRYYQGVLIGIKGFADDPVDDGDIHYERIAAIIGLGSDRNGLADFLDIASSNRDFHTAPYMMDGEPLSVEKAKQKQSRSSQRTPERARVASQSVFVGLKGWKRWKVLTDPELVAENYWQDERNSSMELVEGYLNAPAYQLKTPTGQLHLPTFETVHIIMDSPRGAIDPLLTQRDIMMFYERHKDKYPKWLAKKVRAALFRPYKSIANDTSLQLPEISSAQSADEQKDGLHDIFTDWKASKLHLWHFDRREGGGDELGIATSTISQAINKHHLVKMQGLNLAGQDFLSDLLTELHSETASEIYKQESASLINEYLHHFTEKATVTDSGVTIRLPSGEVIEVKINRPSITKKGGVYLEREENDSHIEVRAFVPEQDAIEFATAFSVGREPQVTEKDRWLFLDALKAVTVLTLLPKMIIDIYGSYPAFQSFLQENNMEWTDESQPPLYSMGLGETVEKLRQGEEKTIFGMLLARRFGNLAPLSNEALSTMKDFDPQLLETAA